MKTYFDSFNTRRRVTGGCMAARLAAAKYPGRRCKKYFRKLAAAGWRLQIFLIAAANSESCPKAAINITE